MASSQFEFGLLRSNSQQMNVPRGVFVERHGLKKNVVSICLSCNFVCLIDNFVDSLPDLESVRIHLLANFAFKPFPVKGPHVLVLSTRWFFLFLSKDPTLQALEMDKTDSTLAFACNDKWVLVVIFIAPADSALDVVHFVGIDVFGSSDLHGLSQLLMVQFFLGHLHEVTFEILDSEPNSSELDSVKLLDLVVIFASFVLQRSSYQPKSINRLFFLFFGANSVVKEIAFFIFFELAKTPAVWMLDLVDDMIRLSEIYLILIPDDLALRLSLERHLDDVS